MRLPNSLRFELRNGVTEKEAIESEHIIYAHACSMGTYVGRSKDPVSRWQIHLRDAFDELSPYYNDPIKEAIRKCGNDLFTHYIVAVASFEKAAANKEAAAIEAYSDRLNARSEYQSEVRDYGFRPLEKQIGQSVVLKPKARKGQVFARTDKERRSITAEVYLFSGRKRLRSLENPFFPSGLNIECDRSEREKFDAGDRVRVKVALSTKPNGTQYLTTGKGSPILPAKE